MATSPITANVGTPVLMRAVYFVGNTISEESPHTIRPQLDELVSTLDHIRSFARWAELVVPPKDVTITLQPSPDVTTRLNTLSSTVSKQFPVHVVVLRMNSPLEVILEIPPPLWVVAGFGFIALAERIAIAPVRISRKRKEEILKSAQLDHKIKTIAEMRADALAETLQANHDDPPRPELGFLIDVDDATEDLADAQV